MMIGNPKVRRKRIRISGFTLVELIVVITILAILATIGFLALSGYAQDAKDSAIKANVRSLQTAITSEAAITNNSPRYYVEHDSDYALSWAFAYVDGTDVALTGWNDGSAPTDSNYTAGKPDFKKLKLNPDKFKVSASGLPGRTLGMLAGASVLRADSAEASYDANSLMAAGADFTTDGGNGKKRTVSYVQTAGISPATKLANVMGNFPTSNVPAGKVSGLFRAEPGSATNLTGALVDGKKASETNSLPTMCASPTVIDYAWSTGSIAVPAGCTTVVAKLWGGGGGGGKSGTTLRQGGGGGYAETSAIPVSWTLHFVVGGGGAGGCIDTTLCNPMVNVAGSFGGGGGAMQGNGGGGGTYLANASSFAPANLIAAAGGGGGAGTSTTLTLLMQWGAGGGTQGVGGDNGSAPGTQSAWGAAAFTNQGTAFLAMNGSYLQWGSTKTATNSNYASGGGGGYYGGGTGWRQGSWIHTAGAGGSGYVAGWAGTLTSGTADKPGNQSDPYATSAGTLFGEGGGTNHNNGNNGRIVLIWGN